jgi:hypothetical protein
MATLPCSTKDGAGWQKSIFPAFGVEKKIALDHNASRF